MVYSRIIRIIFAGVFLFAQEQCSSKQLQVSPATKEKKPTATYGTPQKQPVVTGAEQLNKLLPVLLGKRVALVVNHTSMISKTHLADTLKARGVGIARIFAPEHGFRGTADAGEHVKDNIDARTALPVVSLYGDNKKPTAAQLADVDVVVFDIQDVGTRFYTYISTLHYVMEACAENNKLLVVLDRPNPNGDYVDGPVLDMAFKSFVGMHPIPVVHGLTIGELAMMITGEGWLPAGKKCDVTVIPMLNWTHADHYSLPVKPSPNLPNDQAIRLYPSLCFFEGTVISVGRGTQTPFQVIGNPEFKDQPFSFTPVSIPGMAKNPMFENKKCFGLDLQHVKVDTRINLQYLIDFYRAYPDKEKFFNNYFNTLAGGSQLKQQIREGLSEEQIRMTWKPGLDSYRELRKKYLLYP